ncbi:hypothetical protein FRB90_007439 [Tulasnella sp. 427]|nr:hypothetical protein FRB90_007439 [Tulasnella sp. 427]
MSLLAQCSGLLRLSICSRISGWASGLINGRLIELPRLQEFRITLDKTWQMTEFLPCLIIPFMTSCHIEIVGEAGNMSSEETECVEQVLFGRTKTMVNPEHDIKLEVYRRCKPISRLRYIAGRKTFDIQPESPYWGKDCRELAKIVTDLQKNIGDPPLTVMALDANPGSVGVVQRLRCLNVTKVHVKSDGKTESASPFFRIFDLYATRRHGGVKGTDCPFIALGELILEGLRVNLAEMTELIARRYSYLNGLSRTPMKKVVLLGCVVFGMEAEDATFRLASAKVQFRLLSQDGSAQPPESYH